MQQEPTAFSIFKYAELKNFLLSRFLFIMMLRMMGTVVGWQIYHITNDPLSIGMVGLSEFVPAFLLALYAGHIVDISERRQLMLRSMSLYTLCAAGLLLISTSMAQQKLPSGSIPFFIYSMIFFTGVIRAFSGPTFQAILAHTVPKELLARAAAASSATWLIASICGHAAGGFMIAGLGYSKTYLAIIIIVLIAVLIMSRIEPKPAANSGDKKTWDSVKEGLQFVWKTKDLLGSMALDLFAVLFGGAVALIPVFAKDILKVGPIGFGWLNAAADIGSIIIILWLTFHPLKRKQGLLLLYAVAGFGICIILFGLSRWYWLSFAALMVSGVLDGISVVVRSTIFQLKTPNEMRGRVSSVNSMFINSSNELGQFESGVTAKIMGSVPAVLFGGCMTLLVVIITWFKAPSLKKTEF
jgi:MFS family permease